MSEDLWLLCLENVTQIKHIFFPSKYRLTGYEITLTVNFLFQPLGLYNLVRGFMRAYVYRFLGNRVRCFSVGPEYQLGSDFV